MMHPSFLASQYRSTSFNGEDDGAIKITTGVVRQLRGTAPELSQPCRAMTPSGTHGEQGADEPSAAVDAEHHRHGPDHGEPAGHREI